MLVIGVGNEMRRDDGVGIVVVRALAPFLATTERALELSGEGTQLMEAWSGQESVVVVDAVNSGGEPGTLYRLDLHETEPPTGFFRYSSHRFGLAEAAAMSRALGRMPGRLIVYGVEGADWGAGLGLSDVVNKAAQTCAEQVLDEIQVWRPRV